LSSSFRISSRTRASAAVPFSRERLYDAVDYILNVASKLGLPVVINFSQGSQIGPHDGFTDEEDWLTNKFAGATGQLFVAAAGNEGDLRKHAWIELVAATPVEVPWSSTTPAR
jgi:hypothetical protein